MLIPNPCRLGWWNPVPETRYQPFTHLGFYQAPLPDSLPGQVFSTMLDEGTIWFRVGVLYRPDVYAQRKKLTGSLRNCLEVILMLDPRSEKPALDVMWEYDVFTQETPNEYRSLGIL